MYDGRILSPQHGLVVRTPGFHAVDPSSNPGTSTSWGHVQSSEIPVSAWLTLKIHSKSVK